MTVRRVLDMLDTQMEEHRKAIKGHECLIARIRAMRQELITAAEAVVQQEQRRGKRKERVHAS